MKRCTYSNQGGGIGNKAFTLIELLAVVVILAVIALIATPIIMNIINKAKKSAFADSAYGIIDSARLYYAESMLDGGLTEDQTFLFEEGKPSGLSFNGSNPKGGIVQVTSSGEIMIAIHNGEWCAVKSKTDSKVTLKKYVEGECVIPDTANDPVITLNGEKEVLLRVGEMYQELGAIAKTVEGKTLTYITEIRKNDTLVEQIETSVVGSIYIITYTATNNNKTVSVSRTVKVVDENGPVITFDRDKVELESEEVESYNIFTGVTITDNIDGTIDTSKVKIEGSLEKIPGTYNITYKVKDSSGNETSKTRTFVVKDLTKPTITLEPNEQNKFVKEQTIKIKATDNIQVKEVSYVVIKDGVRGEVQTGETVTLNETGNYEIEVTAIDSSNNTNTITSATYKIDRESPTMTFENATIKVTEVGDYDLKTGVTVSDNSGLEPTLTYSGDLDAMIGEYKVTYTATDEAGNSVTKERTFTVVEAEGPILNFSDIGGDTWRKATTVTVYATDNNNLGSFTYEIIKDNVSESIQNVSVSGKSAEKSITLNQDGIYTIKINGSDIYGNTSNMSSSTYKIDTTPPTAGTATFSGTLGSNDWYTSDITVNIENGSDSLSGHSSTTSNVSSITSNTSGTKITITTTDLAGNSASREYTVKVDKTAPTLTLKSTDSAKIEAGDSVTVSSYYNTPSYSISGGSMSCSPINTSVLLIVAGSASTSSTVSCTARGGNGLTTSVDKTVVIYPKLVSIATEVNASSETRTNDPGGNRRYVGSNPNNYVRFNNELWRIIGIFNGQAKIIRNDFYNAGISWNSNNVNDWSTSTLQTELNGTYLNSIDSTYKEMIDGTHIWNIGGTPNNYSNWTRSKIYSYERGTTVYSGRQATWTGAIGLMYVSDYGYSTSATNSECDSFMSKWHETGNVENCKNNSWLVKSQWTLSPITESESNVFYVYGNGLIIDHISRYKIGASPVIYLKSNVKITSGTGSSTDPYLLTQ